jgi:hypothetical protein
VAAGIVEAERDQVTHTMLAHAAERHRRVGVFLAAGASSAMTGSGVMTVVGALPASPVCMELDSFTAMTGTLCG